MFHYIVRRLILLPITLLCIVLVNFVIVNLAPGDPVTISEVSQEGATRQEGRSMAFGSDDRYLQFREFYGLTLPILFNTWPFTSEVSLRNKLWQLAYRKSSSESTTEMNTKDYDSLRISVGDRARFVMPLLIAIAEDPNEEIAVRRMAIRFFVRGGTRQAYLGAGLTEEQRAYNRKIGQDNNFLLNQLVQPSDPPATLEERVRTLRKWYDENRDYYNFTPSTRQKISMIFVETRFSRYMGRVLRLDFGTMRNDPNKTVVSEVAKRFKYSLTLSIIPMFVTFFLCQVFGMLMAVYRNRLPDLSLNLLFLALYAIPIFIIAPFLIEKIALNNTFPFTNTPIPISGFTSPESIYAQQTSLQRIVDVMQHIALPLIAIMYGTLAAQTRLSRTAILEVLHQDYVRTARAKGLTTPKILVKHVGRNAAITVVTSLAGSLGVVLGGSLIVETLFEIDGFGKFFYEAVLNRDYNVIMFSALAGSFLTLVGYLVADIAYTVLDPRVTLE